MAVELSKLEDALRELSYYTRQRARDLIAQLDTTGGRIDATPANIERVAWLMQELQADMFSEEYIELAAAFARSFATTTPAIIAKFAAIGAVSGEVLDAIVRAYQERTIEILTNPSMFEDSLLAPIHETLIVGVARGSEVAGLLGSVEGLELDTSKDIPGEGIEQTLERTMTVAAADDVGAQFFRYQGRPIKSTRDFCREREGHVWHRSEINEWGRKAAEDPEGEGWPGMVEGTNEETIWIYLGGWYGDRKVCRHVLVPLIWADVPPEDRERMIAFGLVDEDGKERG